MANSVKLKEKECELTGTELREMLNAGTLWLEKSADSIDALNVFPVPDGDTGTNMLLTMRAALEEAYRAPDHSASVIAGSLAKGALMGARGNSGVILSQIFRGLSEGLRGKDCFNGKEFATALVLASKVAYKSLSCPVEGTILTVIKDLSARAKAVAGKNGSNLVDILEAAVKTAYDSVANTPNLLKVLKDAGVVDAGGQGLYTIMEGALLYLKGEHEDLKFKQPQMVTSTLPLTPKTPTLVSTKEKTYGYCTEFLLQDASISVNKIRKKLEKKGDSVMVVGEGDTIRVHIHTPDPGNILHYATSKGTLHAVKVQNMDDQHEDFLEVRKEITMPSENFATVVVVNGEGLIEVFKSLGVTHVIPGGKTMNPSARELLAAIEAAPSNNVILLPNNSNIILNAKQVGTLTTKKLQVIPTVSIPQGIASLLAINYDANIPDNVAAMEKARQTVRTIEITRAIRSGKFGKLKVAKGHYIGLLDGELVNDTISPEKALSEILNSNVDLRDRQIATVYYQDKKQLAQLEKLGEELRKQYPGLEIELIYGGQPNYDYIASVE